MDQIEFITVIEPPTKKDEESGLIPSGTPSSNLGEWEIYRKREIGKNYSNFPEPIEKGIFDYKLFNIDNVDLEKVINLHIGDLDINESVSLFGGYAISKNGIIELLPQCCGLLEEIKNWKNILYEDFEDFYLREGHPSPLITKNNTEIVIYCTDDFESFYPLTTKEEIRLDYAQTKVALIKVLDELNDFSTRLNLISPKFKTENVANIMIWGINKYSLK